jgi:uncharacterized membrane protein YhaH (DUF805 family)
MNWGALFFSAEGRLEQPRFWLGVIILCLFGVLVHLFPLIGSALWLVSLYCWICLYTKRLHDIGRSGWWQLAPWVASLVLLVFGGLAFVTTLIGALVVGLMSEHLRLGVGFLVSGFGTGFVLLMLSASAHVVFLLIVGLIRSERGANRYGAEPGAPPVLAEP